jgi:hypothetical protein
VGSSAGGGINTELARLGAAMRNRPVQRRSDEKYGDVYAPGVVSFEFSEIAVESVTFTLPSGLYVWTVNMQNVGMFDTVLFQASAQAGAAGNLSGRCFAIDSRSVTLVGGNECTVFAQPASYEAEAPFIFDVAAFARPVASAIPT